MRRLFFTLTTIAALSSSVALADADILFNDREPRRNMLLINPGDLFHGVLSLEYERGVAPWFGVTFGLAVTTFRSVFEDDRPYDLAIAPELGFRFHFIRHAPGGLWIGPYINAGAILDGNDDTSRDFTWGMGAALGYNFVIGKHFTFQLGAGGGFNDYGDRIRWDPRLKLGIGASW